MRSVNASLPSNENETAAVSRKSKRPGKPTRSTSDRWRKKNAKSRKNCWKMRGSVSNEPVEKKKLSRAELKEKAKTDPEAAREFEALKARETAASKRFYERQKERMAADPEYAAMVAEQRAEYNRRHTEKRKAEREALVELARTDPEAAKKLAEMRKYQSEASVRSYQKMRADAEAGDPGAIARYEAHLAKRREDYHKKKSGQEDIPA